MFKCTALRILLWSTDFKKSILFVVLGSRRVSASGTLGAVLSIGRRPVSAYSRCIIG